MALKSCDFLLLRWTAPSAARWTYLFVLNNDSGLVHLESGGGVGQLLRPLSFFDESVIVVMKLHASLSKYILVVNRE